MSTVSYGLQRELEQLLAGYSLIQPLEVLEIFQEIEGIIHDETTKRWLRYLWNRKSDIAALNKDEQIKFVSQFVIGFEDGGYKSDLLKWLNRTWLFFDPCEISFDGTITWRGYQPSDIIGNLSDRIIRQRLLREGLPDLRDYFIEVLRR